MQPNYCNYVRGFPPSIPTLTRRSFPPWPLRVLPYPRATLPSGQVDALKAHFVGGGEAEGFGLLIPGQHIPVKFTRLVI